LFVLNTGCRWRDLAPQLGVGSGHTAWRRLRAWQAAGVRDRLHHLVLDELSEANIRSADKGYDRLRSRCYLHRRGIKVRIARRATAHSSSCAPCSPWAAW
jgi:transposase